MSNEHKIIAACLYDSNAHLKINSVISGQLSSKEVFSEVGQIVYKYINNYYENDKEAGAVDVEILKEKIHHAFPNKVELFDQFFSFIPEEVSAPNIVQFLIDQRKEIVGSQLASALLDGNNTSYVDELLQEYQSLNSIVEEETKIYNGVDVSSILNKVQGKNLIPIYPSYLNDKLDGGIPRQGQMLIYARPDVGKSTVAMNLAAGAAMNGYKVLYCGNEDPAGRMVLRFLSRITEMTKYDIQDDPDMAMQLALDKGYSNFFFADIHPGTISEIKQYVKQYEPDVVIVDQIRLLRVNKNSPTINLEEGCIAMRNMAKEFNFVSVLVTQAGDSASNKLILEMEDVEWSNTGVQGQQDVMIGVGQNPEFKASSKVMFSITKNKLTEPISPFPCKINYVLNKVMGPGS